LAAAGDCAGLSDERTVFHHPSLRVISDHIRSAAFLIADGVIPGNEDRNYVLRRIIRRALRHGNKLNIREPFFHQLVEPLVNTMGEAYPALSDEKVRIEKTLLSEEERFANTLGQGMAILESAINELTEQKIPGEVVFKLYDPFGFPADLTADVARERGLQIDEDGFEKLMTAQRQRGRAASRFDSTLEQRIDIEEHVEFLGYEGLAAAGEIVGLYRQNDDDTDEVKVLKAGETGVVILNRTPFYAEAGGQVGDAGTMQTSAASFVVTDLSPRFCIERSPIKDDHTGLTRLQYFHFIGIVIVLPVQAHDFASRRQPVIAQEFNMSLNLYPLFQGAVEPTRRSTPLTLRRHQLFKPVLINL
jgi:alanyl-tRNA synthetase